MHNLKQKYRIQSHQNGGLETKSLVKSHLRHFHDMLQRYVTFKANKSL